MSVLLKKRIIEKFGKLSDQAKLSAIQEISHSVKPMTSKNFSTTLQNTTENELKNISNIVSQFIVRKNLRQTIQTEKNPTTALATSFLRPSQIKSLTQTSKKTHKTFYGHSISKLEQMDFSKIKNHNQLFQKLAQFSSLEILSLPNYKFNNRESVILFANALQHLIQLKILILNNNNIENFNS